MLGIVPRAPSTLVLETGSLSLVRNSLVRLSWMTFEPEISLSLSPRDVTPNVQAAWLAFPTLVPGIKFHSSSLCSKNLTDELPPQPPVVLLFQRRGETLSVHPR